MTSKMAQFSVEDGSKLMGFVVKTSAKKTIFFKSKVPLLQMMQRHCEHYHSKRNLG